MSEPVEKPPSQFTSLETRVTLLKRLPLFSTFSSSELEEFASLFREVSFAPGQVIVQEDALVDSVFILVQGKVEIQKQREVIAQIYQGEAIGLSETSFFSEKGTRTATAIAQTEVLALQLDLKTFHEFLGEHPHLLPTMKKQADKFLRQNFIKAIEPFKEIDFATLNEVAEKIETFKVPAGHTFFKQGDPAKECYLLTKGSVEIIQTRKDGTSKKIADLEAENLFGELAVLISGKRNATVQATTDSEGFILHLSDVQKLLKHARAHESITELLMDRYRPQRKENISIHTRQNHEQKTMVILKDAETGSYFKTSDEGLFVWEMLDGEHTIQEISIAFLYRFKKLAIDDIGNLVLRLMESGFVKLPRLATIMEAPKPSPWMRALASVSRVLTYEYAIKDVDPWLTRFYDKFGYLFFTKMAKAAMAILSVVGIFFFFSLLTLMENTLLATSHAWFILILAEISMILTVPLHEFAHALTTKAYGNQVHRMGIGWFWLGPMAFTDTTDMWLNTRKARIMVNIAGPYINVVAAGILSCLAYFFQNVQPLLSTFFWLAACSSYLVAFYNLNPLIELDGYYMLMDAFDKSNLRFQAIEWLIKRSKKTFTSFQLIKQSLPEITYWGCSILFIFTSAFVLYLMQNYVIVNVLPQGVRDVVVSSYLRWIFVLFVLLLSFANLYFQIRRAKKLFG